MTGSTKSNKRMGEMVKTVSAHGCPKGYTGTPPDCKKITENDAIVVYDKETTNKTFKGKERRQQKRKNRKERKAEKKENKDT